MRIFRTSALHVLTASAIFSLSPAAALYGSTTTHSGLAGVYLSTGGKTAEAMSVSLGADGTATVVEDPGNGAMTYFGHWVGEGSQVKVTFDATEGAPTEPPMVFQSNHDGLQAVTWDHAAWGKATPPPLKKGFKVKQSYWFTTVP